MSPTSTHVAEFGFDNALKAAVIASSMSVPALLAVLCFLIYRIKVFSGIADI